MSDEKTTKNRQYSRGIIVKIAIKCIKKRTIRLANLRKQSIY